MHCDYGCVHNINRIQCDHLHKDTPGSLPHILLGVLEHDRTSQRLPRRRRFAHMVMLRHLELDGLPVAIDEYLPVGGLPVVGIPAVALRLLALLPL